MPRLDRPDARSVAGSQYGSWSRLYGTLLYYAGCGGGGNQNCQSLNAHWDNFKQQIIELENNKLKFDVIGLTETFRLIAPVEHFSLEGYHPFISKVRPPNDDNGGGGGG